MEYLKTLLLDQPKIPLVSVLSMSIDELKLLLIKITNFIEIIKDAYRH
jgi:hypothetical protein